MLSRALCAETSTPYLSEHTLCVTHILAACNRYMQFVYTLDCTTCTGKVDTVANVPSSSPQQRICCHTLADNLLRSNPDSILSSASFSCHSCCAHPFIFSGGGATEMMGRWELIVSLSHLSLNSCHSMQLCPGTQLENLSDFTCGKNILHFKSIRKFEYPKQHFLIFY